GVVEQRGALAFLRIGCASCHFPALVTGPNRVAALSLKIVQAYTDLLLHDMGPDLADICLGRAEPAEFRTEPLMGLRFKTAFLHDGRAGFIAQAIAAHGGEAAGAATLVQAVTGFGLSQILGVAAQRAITDMRRTVQAYVLRLPVSYFDSTKSGILISRIMSDAEGIRNLVGTGLVQLVGGLLS